MKKLFFILFVLIGFAARSQNVESIHFNLYTDSLKKGVHNYINVDGKLADGSFYPLMASEVKFTSSAGKWEGNSLIIDSSFIADSVVVTASLINKKWITKKVVIYIKKSAFEGEVKDQKELFEEWKNDVKTKPRKKN